MATKSVSFDIEDGNLTAKVWQAVLDLYPFPDPDNPPDVSTVDLKIAYYAQRLYESENAKISNRVKINAGRTAKVSEADTDLQSGI